MVTSALPRGSAPHPLRSAPRSIKARVHFEGYSAAARLSAIAASVPAARPRKPRRLVGVAPRGCIIVRLWLLRRPASRPRRRWLFDGWRAAGAFPLSPLRPSGSAPPSLRCAPLPGGYKCTLASWCVGRGRSVVGRSAFRSPRLRLNRPFVHCAAAAGVGRGGRGVPPRYAGAPPRRPLLLPPGSPAAAAPLPLRLLRLRRVSLLGRLRRPASLPPESRSPRPPPAFGSSKRTAAYTAASCGLLRPNGRQ